MTAVRCRARCGLGAARSPPRCPTAPHHPLRAHRAAHRAIHPTAARRASHCALAALDRHTLHAWRERHTQQAWLSLRWPPARLPSPRRTACRAAHCGGRRTASRAVAAAVAVQHAWPAEGPGRHSRSGDGCGGDGCSGDGCGVDGCGSDGCGGDNDGDESDDDRAGVMTMAPVLPANRATETCKAKTAPK